MTFKQLGEMARNLGPGESRAGIPCPVCGHGESFSVFATDDGRGWKCHRASCGHSRFYPWDRSEFPALSSARFKPARPYPYPLQAPGRDHPIWTRLGLPDPPSARLAATLGVAARAGFLSEVVWACRGLDFALLGHVSRDYDTKTIRTWRATPDRPIYGYWSLAPSSTLWIVEDPVSAARLGAGGTDALALLGTSLGPGVLEEIRVHAMRYQSQYGKPLRILVALDPDATDKSMGLVRKLTELLPAVILWIPLRSDPKDLPWGELKRLIEVNRA